MQEQCGFKTDEASAPAGSSSVKPKQVRVEKGTPYSYQFQKNPFLNKKTKSVTKVTEPQLFIDNI